MRSCSRFGRVVYCVTVLFTLAGMFGCATTTSTTVPSAKGGEPAVKPAVSVQAPPQGSAQAYTGPISAPYFPPPDRIDLCGEPVPLDLQEVQERFDREFTLVVYNHAQIYLWLKRMERYFPWVEERLRYYGLPDDLKYVAIAESDLLPNACSPKGAAGPWQFMPATGSAYGLEQRKSVDKRYDFERSTDSAFLYLQDLQRKYRSWSLAIAAYNCGEKRILNESRAQGVRDYYHMRLPQETERYVFRILAIKAVLSNPTRYGYDLPKGGGYQELKLDRVQVSLSSAVSIQSAAAAAGITFREFKRLNPAFRGDDIPAGAHEVKVPTGTGRIFEQNFRTGSARTSASVPAASSTQREVPLEEPQAYADEPEPVRPEPVVRHQPEPAQSRPEQTKSKPEQSKSKTKPAPPAEKFHTVKKGDTLGGIAQKYDVSTSTLKQTNKMKSDILTPGQKLRIP